MTIYIVATTKPDGAKQEGEITAYQLEGGDMIEKQNFIEQYRARITNEEVYSKSDDGEKALCKLEKSEGDEEFLKTVSDDTTENNLLGLPNYVKAQKPPYNPSRY